jgi:hypothetical protein
MMVYWVMKVKIVGSACPAWRAALAGWLWVSFASAAEEFSLSHSPGSASGYPGAGVGKEIVLVAPTKPADLAALLSFLAGHGAHRTARNSPR